MADQEIRFQIGDVLQMQPVSGDKKRYGARLIGYLQDKSIIVTMPKAGGKAIIVRDGQLFVVRVLTQESVHGFQSRVLKIFNQPYPHVHLSYPRETESKVIRKAQRVKLALPAGIHKKGVKGNADEICHIIDLSTTGARLKALRTIGDLGRKISITTTVNLAERDEELVIHGVIRNVDVLDEMYFYGVEFKPLDRRDELIVHGFVLEQVVNSRS